MGVIIMKSLKHLAYTASKKQATLWPNTLIISYTHTFFLGQSKTETNSLQTSKQSSNVSNEVRGTTMVLTQ